MCAVVGIIPALSSEQTMMAVFAKAAYRLEGDEEGRGVGFMEYLKEFSFFDEDLGKMELMRCEGTRIAALKDKVNKRVVFAYRGTANFHDVIDDIFIVLLNRPLFFASQASLFVNSVLSSISSDYEIVHTGHSLGGTVAELMAYETRGKAIIFNPGGIKKLLATQTIKRWIRINSLTSSDLSFLKCDLLPFCFANTKFNFRALSQNVVDGLIKTLLNKTMTVFEQMNQRNLNVEAHLMKGDVICNFHETSGVVIWHEMSTFSVSRVHSLSNYLPLKTTPSKRPVLEMQNSSTTPPSKRKRFTYATPSPSISIITSVTTTATIATIEKLAKETLVGAVEFGKLCLESKPFIF